MIVNIPDYDGPGVYKLTHTVTGRVYIGSAMNCSARLKQHDRCPQNLRMSEDSALGPFVAEIVKSFPEGCFLIELARAEKEAVAKEEGLLYNDPHHLPGHNYRRGKPDDFLFNLTVPKGQKEAIQKHAEAQGESVNGFIQRAIKEAIARDSGA